ncbi:MAG: DUF4124 domain-containing protein [Burkholderiales bacterium]
MAIKLSGFALLLAAPLAMGETCKYVDDDGNVTYSNIAIKNAKKISCFADAPKPLAKPAKAATPPPANFPSVDDTTQKKRDESRRKILEDELGEEEGLLIQAKKALTEAESVRLGDEANYQKFLDRVQPYKDAVSLHEKNVAALKQELANLK